mgnify:CR=1 FL=1
MPPKKKARIRSVKELRASVAQGDMGAKRELAERMLVGKQVEKDEKKAVSFLEECVANGDTDAMMTLAVCCALGRGMEQNVVRAMDLLSNSAMKGNKDAQSFMIFINNVKGNGTLRLSGLLSKCFCIE